MNRGPQLLLFAASGAFCWLGMQAVHEFGRVLHAWWSGGGVVRVVLHPLTISRTDVSPNPNALFVVWGGPFWGCVLPVAAWATANRLVSRFRHLFAFFAGFCLVANGAYIASGCAVPVGDAADLLRLGTPAAALALWGLPVFAAGLWFWHGLGPHFGLGPASGAVDRCAVIGTSAALVILLAFELALGSS